MRNFFVFGNRKLVWGLWLLAVVNHFSVRFSRLKLDLVGDIVDVFVSSEDRIGSRVLYEVFVDVHYLFRLCGKC